MKRRCRRGSISVYVLLTGMVLVYVILSLANRQLNEAKSVQSFQHSTQAHYLTTSGMDMALWQLSQWSTEAVASYEEAVMLAVDHETSLPVFHDYVVSHVILQLYRLNAYESSPLQNLFPELVVPHSIRMKIEPSFDETVVQVYVQGTFGNARTTQRAKVILPFVKEVISSEEMGSSGSEEVIQGLTLFSRYQRPSIWY